MFATFMAVLLCACDAVNGSGSPAADASPAADGGRADGSLAAGRSTIQTPPVTCRIAAPQTGLPEAVRESSGLARSRRDASIFWTHNDSGNAAELFGLDVNGRIAQRVRIDVAMDDWEDIETGECDGGSCIFVADIGDNDARRSTVTVHRVIEPAPGTARTGATASHARYPDAPQDAEGLFRLPSGEMYLVTKGSHGPVGLYQFPAPTTDGGVGVLRKVRDLFPKPANDADRVTAATATPDGRWVALRTSRTLYLYPAEELAAGEPVQPALVDLRPVGEMQGEAIAMADDGTVWLTSEAENKGALPTWSRLQCTLPAPPVSR